MKKIFTLSETSPQIRKLELEDISYIELPKQLADISDYIVSLMSPHFKKLWTQRLEFEAFLHTKFLQDNISEWEIVWVALRNNILEITLSDQSKISIPIQDFLDYKVSESLWTESLEDIETRVKNIHEAIESIYQDNDRLFEMFDDDINDEDRVKSWEYAWKNLRELRELYTQESNKLKNAYIILWDSQKQQDLLHKEIEFFAGIWDVYEGWAQYFSLSDREIQHKVWILIANMTLDEVFQTIIRYNEKINSNNNKSDIVTQVNAKLMTAFYQQTLERIQQENSSNQVIFTFVRIITGREKILKEFKNRRGEVTGTQSHRIQFDNTMANYEIASKALLFIMHRPDGVFDEIKKSKQDFEFWDPEIEDKNPWNIVDQTIWELNKLQTENPDFWKEVLKLAWFWELIDSKKTYSELSYDEKIQLGALYRVWKYFKALTPEQLKNKDLLREFVLKTSDEAFEALQKDLNDEFDGTSFSVFWLANPNFFGYSSDDVGLTWDFAEIFDLYQDIHGNSWFFDLHDANEDWFQTPSNIATLGVWIIAWIIILPLATPTIIWLWYAGAKIWFATATAWLLTTRQWYDTRFETVTVELTNFIVEIMSSAAFMVAFWWFLRAAGVVNKDTWELIFNHAMLLSKEAWKRWGIIDKIIIVFEVIGWMTLVGVLQWFKKQLFTESYFDTDTHYLQDGELKERKS